jgi:hypothetical protein
MTSPDPVPFPIDHLTSRGAVDDVALIDRAGTMTFRDLETAVAALAGWLAGQRVRASRPGYPRRGSPA